MPKKTSTGGQRNSVSVGNISGVSGNLNIVGGNINATQTTGLSAKEIQQLFDKPYSAIETRPDTPVQVKEDLNYEVKEIQSMVTQAVQKNEKVDENSLSRHFRMIARMAPDILEVVTATLANPALGMGVAVKKIAEKAKEGTQAA